MRVELKLGQQVAQRDAEEGPGRERQRGGGPAPRRSPGPSRPHPDEEQGHPRGDHQAKPRLTRWASRRGTPGAEHQADDRQGVGRLVDDGGQEDAPGRRPDRRRRPATSAAAALASATPPASECAASPNAAAPQCSDVPLAPGTAPPGAAATTRPAEWPRPVGVLVGMRRARLGGVGGASWWWKAKNRSRKNSASSPTADQRSVPGRAHPHGLGHHVEERRAQHRPGREAQVDLEPGVVKTVASGNTPPSRLTPTIARQNRARVDLHRRRRLPRLPTARGPGSCPAVCPSTQIIERRAVRDRAHLPFARPSRAPVPTGRDPPGDSHGQVERTGNPRQDARPPRGGSGTATCSSAPGNSHRSAAPWSLSTRSPRWPRSPTTTPTSS